ncbi:CHAT domain-containing protein [Streptomyces sp. NPDC002276]
MAPDATAAEAVRDRLRQYELTRDPALVTSDQARRDAAELLTGTPGVEEHLLAGRLAWYRHLALGDRRDVRELADVLGLFAPVYADSPDRLPSPLRVVFDAARPDTPLLDPRRLADAAVELLDAPEPDTALAVALQRLAIAHGEDDPLRPELLAGLGEALERRFAESLDPGLLRESVTVRRHAVASGGSGDPATPSMLSGLAHGLHLLFVVLGDSADLTEAVAAAQRAVELSPSEDAALPDRYGDLSQMWFAKFTTTGRLEDAVEAMGAASSALSHSGETHPSRNEFQDHHDRAWEAIQQITTVNRGGKEPPRTMVVNVRLTEIALLRAELEAQPEADASVRAGLLRSMAEVHLDRFEAVGSRPDLEEGIRGAQAAVDTSPPTDPDHFRNLRTFARAMLVSYRMSNDPDALRAAVDAHQQVVNLIPPGSEERAGILTDMVGLLLEQYQSLGETSALESAISTAHAAVVAADPDSDTHGSALAALGAALVQRDRSGAGTESDLDEGIETQLLGLARLPEDHPGRGPVLANVATGLLVRYTRLHQDSDLDEAVARARDALSAFQSRPDQWMRVAEPSSFLTDVLVIRYLSRGVLSDLDEAITVLKGAVIAAPHATAFVARCCAEIALNSLMRLEHSDVKEDLDQATEFSLKAVEFAPDSGLALAARAFALYARASDDEAFVDEAIAVAWQAVERTEQTSTSYPGLLRALASMLTAKANRIWASAWDRPRSWLRRIGGRPGELRKAYQIGLLILDATELLEEAMAADPDNYPAYAVELGEVLFLRAALQRSRRGKEEAARCFGATALSETTRPGLRLSAAHRWGRALGAAEDWNGATAAYALAIDLLPQLAPRSLRRVDQEHGLSAVSGLAADAAACAVRAGRPVDAVRLIEAGRGVLWAQELEERDESTRLREQAPELANRFETLRELLGQSSTDTMPGPTTTEPFGWRAVSDPPTPGAAADVRRRVTDDWHTVLADIRALPDFADFLNGPEQGGMPPHPGVDGPIALLSASAHGGSALLWHPDGHIDPLPLPLLTDRATTAKATEFLTALDVLHQPDVSLREQKTAQDTVRATLTWLWTAAVAPVLDQLGFTRAAPTPSLPRLWCSPSGPLACFPLHAAMSDSGERALDRAVFSYTSTARALRRAQSLPRAPETDATVLVVAMPETPGEVPLPAALDEARWLVRSAGATELIGSAATADAVRSALPSYEVVHFACHGRYDSAHLTESRLLLHDHQTRPFTVRDVSRLDLPRARLAYLSACSTASFSGVLVDEAIHLSAAFQSAGFPQVIGTLWPVADTVAAEVCEATYSRLRTGTDGALEIGRTAHALHGAIRELSDKYPATPSLWAAYLHVGP